MAKALTIAVDTRTSILQQAVHLFAQTGYSGTSMRDIARAVGISAAALYHHFPDKETLYFESVQYAVAEKTSEILVPLSAEESVENRLRGFISALIGFLADDPDFRRLLQREMLDGDKKRLRLLAEDIFAKPTDAITELLEEIAPNLDPHMLFLFITGTVLHHFESAGMRQFYPGRKPEHDDPDYLAAHLTGLLLYGITGMPKD